MARPRLRTNHCAIVTLITREPSRASPAITNEQRTKTNCQKFCTRPESSNPGAFHERTEDEDTAPAVAVDPWTEERNDQRGDANLERANQ